MTGSKDPATLAFYEGAGFEQTKTGFQIRRQPTALRIGQQVDCLRHARRRPE
jgi:hypothetical protein